MALQSAAERLAKLPDHERQAFLSSLTDKEAEALFDDWRGFLARSDQIAPDGDWEIWLALAGRGWGKTEVGARWVTERVNAGAKSIALVAETQKDLEEVMVPRLVKCNPGIKVRTRPVRIQWPTGAEALGYNGTEPDQLRGPEFDTAWVDELAKYRYARETWDMLQFCMRAGNDPRQCVTTTPRPIEVIKSIIGGQEGKVTVTRGSTMDNSSNLPSSFIRKITDKYQGTRLGRQELNAEILSDLPGALWSQSVLDTYRVHKATDMERVVVAVDPAVTNTEDSDEHGIVVAGRDAEQQGFVLEDASRRGTPQEWAREAVRLFKVYDADCIVCEVNQGGDMVANTIRTIDSLLPIKEVRATRGKHVRAEPISSLYEQGRIRHVGQMPDLEGQLTQFTTEGYQGGASPDRADAAIWALTELFGEMIEAPMQESESPLVPMAANSWMGA